MSSGLSSLADGGAAGDAGDMALARAGLPLRGSFDLEHERLRRDPATGRLGELGSEAQREGRLAGKGARGWEEAPRAEAISQPSSSVRASPSAPHPRPLATMSRYSDAIKILGPKVHETIRSTPVLVVGAGGIGSELRTSPRLTSPPPLAQVASFASWKERNRADPLHLSCRAPREQSRTWSWSASRTSRS